MPDTREAILTQLQSVLSTSDSAPVTQVYRNRSDLKTVERPCVIILDGGEQSTGTLTRKSGRGPDVRVDLIEMTPRVFLFLQARKEAQAAERGPELNRYRVGIINAVINDTGLIGLVGSNGSIFYRGCDTDMEVGEAVQGTMLFHFAFQYILDPKNLT